MQILITFIREVIVDDDVDTLNVNSTTKEISGDKNSLLEILISNKQITGCSLQKNLELLKTLNALGLVQAAVNTAGGEIVRLQQFV